MREIPRRRQRNEPIYRPEATQQPEQLPQQNLCPFNQFKPCIEDRCAVYVSDDNWSFCGLIHQHLSHAKLDMMNSTTSTKVGHGKMML